MLPTLCLGTLTGGFRSQFYVRTSVLSTENQRVPITKHRYLSLHWKIKRYRRFQIRNTTSRTFAVASHLVDAGAGSAKNCKSAIRVQKLPPFCYYMGKRFKPYLHRRKVPSVEITREMIRDAGSSAPETRRHC